MANNTSFKLYTDSGLTVLYGGTTTYTHKSDLSDNPREFTLYLGSNSTDTILYASSSPGVDNIVLTPTDALPIWVANTAYILGQDVQPTVSNGKRYEVTTAGTSDASTEPTWPVTIGDTVTDGTVVWTCKGAKHATSEVKLALSSVGLDTAVAGAALNLGTSISSGSANAVAIYIRLTNAVTTVGASGIPEITLNINALQEEAS